MDAIRRAISRTSRLRGSRKAPATVRTRPRRTAVSSRDISADVAGSVPVNRVSLIDPASPMAPDSLIGTMPPLHA
ncbi:hypothetical protein GCM10010205_43270 [Streptomyces nojiriensis]|nr:hypothetical protein GCM10010205_43270 [Streptomyces nojiriensis]